MRQKLGVEHENRLRLSRLLPAYFAENRIANRHIEIKPRTLEGDRFPAYFDASGGNLHVDQTIWNNADVLYASSDVETFGYANFVLAHEFGHICLHTADHNLKFSSAGDGRGYRYDVEVDVEWQADVFGYQLLAPDAKVREFSSAREISERCGLQIERAIKRYAEAGKKAPLDRNRLQLR
jgi:hypothetical protein